MDPFSVLGVEPGAEPDEIARAYREKAKRWHPDRAGAPGAQRMAELNAAYDLLRQGLVEQQAGRAGRREPEPARGPAQAQRRAGDWLDPSVRRRLGAELLRALERDEAVLMTADAATWDSHDVRLAVTDRRLLWLRDDAITDRVRSLPYPAIAAVDERRRGRVRRVATLRVRAASGRRVEFSELAPAALDAIVAHVRPRLAQDA